MHAQSLTITVNSLGSFRRLKPAATQNPAARTLSSVEGEHGVEGYPACGGRLQPAVSQQTPKTNLLASFRRLKPAATQNPEA
jgi:hypothetical protein